MFPDVEKRLLIISFFFKPYESVAVHRPLYWFNEIPLLSCNKISTQVVTAVPQSLKHRNIFYIKPFKITSGDQGIGWILPLGRFLISNRNDYDIALFTGGPFLHFILGLLLKYVLGKKVVYDYRDPFGYNPAFKADHIKNGIKKKLELIFNFPADLVITVNKYVLELINTWPGQNCCVIDNGFNEKVHPVSTSLIDKKIFSFVLAGGYSQGRDLKKFWEAFESIQSNVHVFHLHTTPLETTSAHYKFLGRKDYPEALGIISQADVGLIFTSGHPYESTTKIFDYLRFNKRVLIIADKLPEEGGLYDITKDFKETIIWVKNDVLSIHRAILKIMCAPEIKVDSEKHSRRAGGMKLIQSLNELTRL